MNTLALNVDYVLRTGPFHLGKNASETETSVEYAKKQYESVGEEILVSGSDDFTLYLWKPEKEKKSIGTIYRRTNNIIIEWMKSASCISIYIPARMTGHQQLINDVKFSPNGRVIASASFDKSIKLWESSTGTYIASLRGHVQAVYSIAWSADSRLLASGSADSTLKGNETALAIKLRNNTASSF